MDETRGTIAVVVGAFVVVLLQIIVAPNIAFFGALPNFIVAYILVVAVLRPEATGPVLAFVLGLVFDFMGGGPVGSMAFLLIIASLIASKAFLFLDNDTLFMPLVIIIVATLTLEILYGTFLLATGMSASLLSVFLYRALPCALYDCVVGLIMYPIVKRLIVGQAQKQPGRPFLR